MKRTSLLIKSVLLSMSALSFFGVVAGSVAWFNPRVSVDNSTNTQNNISGETLGAYFAYGNGIPTGEGNRVYGITKPRHLYNLAWLQYLGYFDETNTSESNYGQQYYFELANDIDMEGWVLPPIGTEDHPFIGNFEGNGYVISNLTISNDFNEFNTHPSAIQGWNNTNYKQPHILGMFGVIGNYDDKYDTTNPNCVYSSTANEFKDTALTGITVKSYVYDSLIGLAAGYVDGELSNVAVDVGTLDLDKTAIGNTNTTSYGGFTNNISDHTVVGYTTKKAQIRKVSDTIYGIDVQSNQQFNANAQGSNSQGWGGSIDMMSMFQRINLVRQQTSAVSGSTSYSNRNYTYKTTTTHNANGTTNTTNSTNTSNAKIIYGIGDNATIGNFTFANASATNYMYMGGGRQLVDDYYTYYTHEGYVITNGTYYLNNNNGTVNRGNALNTATRWIFTTGNSTISTEYNGTTYYLINDDGTLDITTDSTQASTWSISTSNSKFVITNGPYYLNYANNAWTLSRLGFYIHINNNYLRYNGSLGNTTNANQASAWSSNANGRITTTYNNQTVYLRNNGGTLTTTTNANQATSWTIVDDGSTFGISNNNYYLSYDSGWKLVQQTGEEFYYIHDGNGHYLRHNSTTNQQLSGNSTYVGNSNSTNIKWYKDGNYYRSTADGSRYLKLYYNESWWSGNITISLYSTNSTNGSYTYMTYDGTYFSSVADDTTYYIRYNSNQWAITDSTSNRTALTVEYHSTFIDITNPSYSLESVTSVINQVSTSTREGDDSYLSNTTTTNEYTATNTTYFPLNVVADGGTDADSITNGNYRPTDANTGYVISGSDFDSNGSSIIRVSSYSKTNSDHNISNTFKYTNSYTSGTIADSDVRTITASGDVPLSTAYPDPENSLEKYGASKSTLLTVLRSSENNYGLHFMSSEISFDNILEATNISILGQSHGNPNDTNANKRTFQMPVNAIDFNLKEKGYINFFAGTYFTYDVTCFFSMHQIFRSGDASGYQIEEMKEIAAIYGNSAHKNWSYAYRYTDGTFSKPYLFTGADEKYELGSNSATPDYVEAHDLDADDFELYEDTYGYSVIFDTEWITNYRHSNNSMIYSLLQNYIYYFEIPMNSGEYCLGSVKGGTGGYLLYLDIGANAAKTERTMIAEHFLYEEFTYSYPLGAAIIQTDTISGNEPTFNEINGICLVVQATYKGELTVNRDDDDVTVSRDSTYNTVAKPSYISDTITSVVDPGPDASSSSDDTDLIDVIAYIGKIQKETYRIQYYDYNVNYEELTITIISDTRTKENENAWSGFTRTVTQKKGNADFVTLTSESQITSGAISIFKYFGVNNANNGTTWSYTDIMNTNSTIYYNGTSAVSESAICSTLTSIILKLYNASDSSITIDETFTLEMQVDEDNVDGTYYIFKDYIFIPVVTGGSVTYIVKSIDGSKVFYLVDDSTQLTAVDQSETVNP